MNQNPFKRKILIVDDDPTSIKLLESVLASDKYEILKACNGKDGLEQAFAHLPDLILLDVMMPGIDGFEVTRTIKRDPRTKDTPIILVTALDDPENKAIGLEAGAEELLNKPVHSTELHARVNSMLRLKQYRDQLSIRTMTGLSYSNIPKLREEVYRSKEEIPLILLVEDNEVDTKLVKNALKEQPFKLKVVNRGSDVFNLVRRENVDLVLLDIILPDINGFEVCRRLKEDHKDIQIVIVTCLDDLESKIKGVELGADDFLVKPIVNRELNARIRVLLEKKGHLDSLRSHYEAALDSAILDWLTGLYNHGYFQQFLDYELKRAVHQGFPVGLIMIDVDDFKLYNDRLGHSAGDAILRELGQVIRNIIREVDLAARYGGEEFAVVLPYTNREGARRVAERIHKAISSHDFFHDESLGLGSPTVSMGISVFPEEGSTKKELIESADKMLYTAKQNGKNQFCML
jgi:two-component system cell cycle response regulator